LFPVFQLETFVLRQRAVRVARFLRIICVLRGHGASRWRRSEMRGQNRDGISRKTGVIDKWALNSENFLFHFKSLV
jgi:hypothetical protein